MAIDPARAVEALQASEDHRLGFRWFRDRDGSWAVRVFLKDVNERRGGRAHPDPVTALLAARDELQAEQAIASRANTDALLDLMQASGLHPIPRTVTRQINGEAIRVRVWQVRRADGAMIVDDEESLREALRKAREALQG